MILFRYLASEMLKTVAAVTFTLLLIIMSGRLVKYLAQVAAGDFAPDVLLLIMLYRIPNFLEVVLPLGLFIGILLSYGRLYVDSEMTVMSACGMSRRRLLLYTLGPAFFVAGIVALISLLVTPSGIQAYTKLVAESREEVGVKAAVAGRFRVDKGSGRVIYIGGVDREREELSAVFVAEAENDSERSLVSVSVAERGHFHLDANSGQRYLVLDNGIRNVGEPGMVDYQVTQFTRFSQLMRDVEVKTYRQEIDGKSTAELWGSEVAEDVAAIQWRISLAILVPIAALIAVSMSKTSHRGGRYGKMFPAFMLYMIYLVGLNAARDAIAKGQMSALPGMWGLHAAFLLLGLLLLYRDSMTRHWWLSWRRRRG